MLKEKIGEIFQKSLLFAVLITAAGLVYSRDGARGLPTPWLIGTNVNRDAFISSFVSILIITFVVMTVYSTLKRTRNTPAPGQAVSSPEVGVNKTFDTLNTIEISPEPSRPVRKPVKKSVLKPKIRLAAVLIALFSLMTSLFPALMEQLPFSDAPDADSCIEAVADISRGKGLDFDTPGIEDAIDWDKLAQDDYLYFYTGFPEDFDFESSGEMVRFCQIYDDDGIIRNNLCFKARGEYHAPKVEILGVMITDRSGKTVYQAGDCKIEGRSLDDYVF